MIEREKFLAAHIENGFRLRLQFQLLDEISKHEHGEDGLWKTYETIIDGLAKQIGEGVLNRYNLTDDYVMGKYNIDDTQTAYLLCDLAFYQAGKDALTSDSKISLTYLDEIDENMDAGFFLGYQPSEVSLAEIVKELDGKALQVASQSRNIDREKGALRRFCEMLDAIKDEDEIISKINLYNDGSYLELPNYVSILAYMLSRRELWCDYYKLLDGLKYFPLQGCIIKGLRNTSDLFAVISQATVNHGRKSVHYLLREQFYNIICEEASLLRKSIDDKQLPEDSKAYIQQLLDGFDNVRSKQIEAVVDIWVRLFGKEEMTVWLTRKRVEAERKQEKYAKRELEIVEMMEGELSVTSEEINGFQLDNKDFESLVSLAGKTDCQTVCVSLMKALQRNVFGERSYPPTTLNEKWFEKVRVIYRCLEKSGLDGLALLKEVRKPLEGYGVDLLVAMRNVRQEAYWLAMLLLSLEESKDESLFDKYVDVLYRDTRFSVDSMIDDVFAPYYVAELLVSQVMLGKKDVFEKRLIADIPYLVFVIRVLSGNQGVMSEGVKELLGNRIRREWELERKILARNKMSKLDFCDEFVKEYME